MQREHRWEVGPVAAYASQRLGRGDPHSARLANLAARPLRELGKFAEAEALLRESLSTKERSGGAHHPDVAVGLNNLAELLWETNRSGEAFAMMSRAT